jgi:DNA-binding NarL/FixJ family response regulator
MTTPSASDALRDAVLAALPGTARQIAEHIDWQTKALSRWDPGSRITSVRATLSRLSRGGEVIGDDGPDPLWLPASAEGGLMSRLLDAHTRTIQAERAAADARSERDALVREASAAGITAYRIAKRLGVAESTIGRILKPTR